MTDRQHAAQLAEALRDLCEMTIEADKIDGPDRHLAINACVIMAENAQRHLAAWDRHTTERTEQQLPLTGL